MDNDGRKVRVSGVSISLDGYACGPNQSRELPFGEHTDGLHDWMFAARSARQRFGMDGGTEGLDNDFVRGADVGIGATIMGPSGARSSPTTPGSGRSRPASRW